MYSNYPIEALLRSPVEWWSAASSGVVGAMALAAPGVLLMPRELGACVGVGMLALAYKRYRQGRYVYEYQKRLTHLPTFRLTSADIPMSQGKQYLGKGFQWQAKHTQRLYDCRQIGTDSFIKPSKSEAGGSPLLHGIERDERNIWMNLDERNGHTLVLGTTRVGKTRLLEVLATQDISRGDTVIVFDPKGDAELLQRIVFEAKRCNREDDLVIFHLGFPKTSARYNPISNFARVTEVANRLAEQLPGSGDSAAFKEFSWRFVNIVARAIVMLGERPSYRNILKYIKDLDRLYRRYAELKLTQFRAQWRDEINVEVNKILKSKGSNSILAENEVYTQCISGYIDNHDVDDEILSALKNASRYDKTYYDKITASLLPLLEKLSTGQSGELIIPDYLNLDDKRPIFDWMQVIRGKKIVYVGLDALSDATVAAAVGNSMFGDLCSVAGQLYKYGVGGNITNTSANKTLHTVCVHADEFNELIGDDFIPLLNKAGGAGVQVTAYTQTWNDVIAKLQDGAKAGQVGGNLNTIICLRVLDEDTAKMVTNKLPQRITVKTLMQSSGVSDSPYLGSGQDFTSNNEDRLHTVEVPMLNPDDLLQLPKGQAFILLSGGTLYKSRLPLPSDDMAGIPADVEAMAAALLQVSETEEERV